VTFDVVGGSARVLKLELWEGSKLDEPIAFNISYESIEMSDKPAVVISGAEGLAGSTSRIVVRVPSATGIDTSLIVNQQSVAGSSTDCHAATGECVVATVDFAGSSSLRVNAMAGPAPKTRTANSYEAKITVTSEMLAQLQERQARYNISWVDSDLDAWLAPSRLLLYPYVARPNASAASPSIEIDGKPAQVVRQYNSRGNHANVPAQGGAVSGNTARTFLGWYVDCSHLEPDVPHDISVKFSWTKAEREASPFWGIFWNNIEDGFSKDIQHQSDAFVAYV